MSTTDSTSVASDFIAALREAGLYVEPSERKPAAPYDPAAAIREQRMAHFKELCPPEFLKPIDRSLLPVLRAWDESDAWAGSTPGVWLWSRETGQGKTRMAWRQFGRLHVNHGKHCLKATGQALAEEYFTYHMDGEPRAFYRWLARCDVLFIDDIDKIDLQDRRYCRMLRELFDELYAARKPVCVTSNEPISYFAKFCGESCCRRMREVAREIHFGAATT